MVKSLESAISSISKETDKGKNISNDYDEQIDRIDEGIAGICQAPDVEYVNSPDFVKSDEETGMFLEPFTGNKALIDEIDIPPDLDPYLATLYTIPLLSPEEERHLFRLMNFCKFKAARIQLALRNMKNNCEEKADRLVKEFDYLMNQSELARNNIIECNLRLVVSVANQMQFKSDFYSNVSDGNESLFSAVELFDYMKGYKFSTYATYAIRNKLIGKAQDANKERKMFAGNSNCTLESSTQKARRTEKLMTIRQEKVREQVLDLLGTIKDERNYEIMCLRFGINPENSSEHTKSFTLEEVGGKFGITKERVRQIESEILIYLRKVCAEKHITSVLDDLDYI